MIKSWDFNVWLEYYLSTKGWVVWFFSKYSFCYIVYLESLFSDLIQYYAQSFFKLQRNLIYFSNIFFIEATNNTFLSFLLTHQEKSIKKCLLSINKLAYCFKNKFIYYYLNAHVLTQDWYLFSFFLKRVNQRNQLIAKRISKRIKKSRKKKVSFLKQKGYIYITFSRRNMFLNISNYKNRCLLVTTLRRLGFMGRRRREYISIFTAIREIKKQLYKYRIKRVVLIFRGWNRFRIAVKNSLRYWDRYKLPVLYVKYTIKIPHNGCRSNKNKRKKRNKRVWLRKKKVKVINSSRLKKVINYIKKLKSKHNLDVKKKYFQKNKNV